MDKSFKLSAKPDTDIWKKPPSTDIFNAPSRPHTVAPLSRFLSASLTFTAAYTTKFDQAGLLLTLTHPSQPRKWIKAGVEFFNDAPRLSTVCCDRFADWSVAGLPASTNTDADAAAAAAAVTRGDKSVTILVEKESSDTGDGLWVYFVDAETGGDRTPMREIAWVFDGDKGWELEVAAAVARPSKAVEGELEATFWDFDVQWDEV